MSSGRNPSMMGIPPRMGGNVVAIYNTTNASGSTITTGQAVFNFDTKEIDTHSAVTTGAAWQFQAPKEGPYILSAVITSQTSADGEEFDIVYFKNGVAQHNPNAISPLAGRATSPQICVPDYLYRGDIVQFKVVSSTAGRNSSGQAAQNRVVICSLA